jgi:hypothetical protein
VRASAVERERDRELAAFPYPTMPAPCLLLPFLRTLDPLLLPTFSLPFPYHSCMLFVCVHDDHLTSTSFIFGLTVSSF